MKYSLDEIVEKAFNSQQALIKLGNDCADAQSDYEQLHELSDVVLQNNMSGVGSIELQKLTAKSSPAYRQHALGVSVSRRKYLRSKVAYGAQEVLCDLYRSAMSNKRILLEKGIDDV